MKTKCIICLLIGALVISAGAGYYLYSEKHQINPTMPQLLGGGHQTELLVDLPKGPAEAPIFKISHHNVTKEEAVLVAESLGFGRSASMKIKHFGSPAAPEYENNTKLYKWHDGPDSLWVYEYSGAIDYGNSDEYFMPHSNLPSEDETVELAKAFLEEHGGFPDDAFLKKVGTVKAQKLKEGEDGGVVEEIPLMVSVIFGRNIGGVPTCGDGSKIRVDFGDNGEVVSFEKLWRQIDYNASRNVKIISAEEAYGRLPESACHQLLGVPPVLQVKGIRLSYMMENEATLQTEARPVWCFSVTSEYSDVLMDIGIDAVAEK